MKQRIDTRVACYQDLFGPNSLRKQVVTRLISRREMQLREPSRKKPIGLLREWLIQVVGSQSRLHVTHRDALIKRAERAAESACRVTLHQHVVRAFSRENGLERREDSRCRLKECLTGKHDVQVVIGLDSEYSQHLVEQGAMLSSDAHHDLKFAGPGPQMQDNRREFDGFGSR